MSTISCNEFSNQLESWMDGIRHPAAEAHVHSCVSCQSLVSDLEAIHSSARSWEVEDATEPPARIWSSLRLQLVAEGLIHDPASLNHPANTIPLAENQSHGVLEHPAGWLDRIFAGVARPALAGSYLVALVAVGVAMSGLGSQRGTDDRWTKKVKERNKTKMKDKESEINKKV